MSQEVAPERRMFDEFRARVDAMLKAMEEETLQTEQEMENALRQGAKATSSSQILLAEVNDFGKDLSDLKLILSAAQK